jgi:hypothetical protein
VRANYRVIWGSGDLVIGKIKKGIGWDDSAKSFRSWDEAMRWMGPLYHKVTEEH